MSQQRNLVLGCLFLCLLSSTTLATGQLAHGATCDPSSSQDDAKCDTAKRLSCDPKNLVCRCHHESRDVYDPDSGRCETKVGKTCEPSNSICVDGAICNKTTNFCECQDGFEQNEDGSCSGGHQTESSFFMSAMAMFLLLISVFVCT